MCLNSTPQNFITSNLHMNSAKMPKKDSVLADMPSSPKKDATLENSSMAWVCRDSRDWMAGWLFSKKLWGVKGHTWRAISTRQSQWTLDNVSRGPFYTD